MKLIVVTLLALCLTLSIVSVQAQADMFGDMDDISVIVNGNVTETIMCNLTGNAVLVEEMDDATEGMDNMTENMTLDVTGRIILIRDFGNMTEKAVIVGRAESIPGNVIIFGQAENITENMTNMTEGMANIPENMTIFTTGNMTGEIMLNTTGGMDNMTEGVENMTVGMENMTVLMTGNMTGNITGDMTKRVVIAKNLGDITGACMAAENVCNITEMATNMTGNMTEPMQCNMTGKAVIIRSMEDMPAMEEDISSLILMDGNTAAIGNVQDVNKMDDEEMDEGMSNVTGKMIVVRSIDDTIRITTRTVTCDLIQSTTVIEGMMEDMAEEMDNMTEEMDNTTEEMDNTTEEME